VSRLTDLIAQAKATDPQLGADLDREFRVLSLRLPSAPSYNAPPPCEASMPFSIRPYRRFPARSLLRLSMAYISGLGLLLTLLVLSSGPAYAEWVLIFAGEQGMTVYADPDTIRQHGKLVNMWSLYDFKIEQYVRGVLLLSSKGHVEYDCAQERLRGLAVTEFSGNKGNGTVVYSDSYEGKWIPVEPHPNSVVRILWKVACSKL
jgi:surface-adhesin protein E